MSRCRLSVVGMILFLLGLGACKDNADDMPAVQDLLVDVQGQYLTRSDLEQQMPKNLSAVDSLAFVNTYVRHWIENELLYDNAEKNIPDLKRINQLVEQYRRQLIMFEYQKRLINERLVKEISEADITAYYEQHKSDFRLNNSIIKGLFLKVPENAPQLEQVRKWYRSNTPQAIENIEKYSLKNAVSYEYFYDKWISFDEVMDNIPYQLPQKSDFLKNNKTLEVNVNGNWYLLNISDYLTKGAIEPLDFARLQIQEILINRRKMNFIKEIENDLYQTALRKNKVKFYQWQDPGASGKDRAEATDSIPVRK